MEGTRSKQCVTPFFGLGFDLSEVVELAGAMRLHRRGVRQAVMPPRMDQPTPAFGYGLLLSLSREIRGR